MSRSKRRKRDDDDDDDDDDAGDDNHLIGHTNSDGGAFATADDDGSDSGGSEFESAHVLLDVNADDLPAGSLIKSKNIAFSRMRSQTPVITIDGRVFNGVYEDTVGSVLVFDVNDGDGYGNSGGGSSGAVKKGAGRKKKRTKTLKAAKAKDDGEVRAAANVHKRLRLTRRAVE
jgi:hypothetical protein